MINFAIVGFGHIGKRHAEMINQNPNANLTAVADILPAELSGFADKNIPYFNSLDALLSANLNIDVVNICTPNYYHADYAIQSLVAGKNVVVEKPVALHNSEAQRILETSLAVKRKVFCVMQNRYSPPTIWLKQIVDNKLLGKIYMVAVNCFWNRDERYYTGQNWHGNAKLDGGTLFTQFSHFIDIIYWLFGDIKNIQGKFNDFNHSNLSDFEDSGTVNFDFVGGGVGVLNYTTSVWEQNLESSITIIGEQGTVKVAGQYMNEVISCNIRNYTMPTLPASNPPNDYGLYKGSAQNHGYVIQNVIDTLVDDKKIATPICEGVKVVDIINRIYDERDKQWTKISEQK
ncbi:MAG: Gfo/Idh/MocA family oxidoreductase [Paludibacter sp.]|jgi:predicted dehydrogenase|nr:Gfo/Idh/MocA family oxidoreductase [Paludibacter sp.]